MMTPEERVLRRQGLKIARAWFDAEPGRAKSFDASLQVDDVVGVRLALEQMGRSVFLERLARNPESWAEEFRAIMALPPTSAAFLEAKKAELHYVALPVSPTLFRSCQPYLEHLGMLKEDHQLTRVINLREESEASRDHCRQLGLDYVHIPVIDQSVPTKSQVEEFCELASVGVNLVHCLAGRGRTGIFVACFRIRKGQDHQEALEQTEREVRSIRPHQQEWVLDFRA